MTIISELANRGYFKVSESVMGILKQGSFAHAASDCGGTGPQGDGCDCATDCAECSNDCEGPNSP